MKQYHNLLRDILANGVFQQNRTGIPTRTLPGAMLKFDLRDGFPAITTKKLAFKSVVGELIAFLRGCTSSADFRELGSPIWDQNANENATWLASPHRKGEDDLGRIYGQHWRRWTKIPVQPKPRLREGLEATVLGVANGFGGQVGEKSPLKSTWEGMIARCYDVNSVSYPLYGGRGVAVCDRWLEYRAFAEDAVNLPGWDLKLTNPKPFAVQLDKDSKGDGFLYSPETCIWASSSDNQTFGSPTYVVEKAGVEYSFTNIRAFCEEHGACAANFSDLWTGNKNAKTRSGFKLVRIDKFEPKGQYVDQIAVALDTLRNNPESRRIIVNAWNAAELDQAALPPCHVLFQLLPHIDNKVLHMTMYQRSCDMFLGVPFNIASYALLLELFAAWCGYTAGTLTMFLADAHIYENHVEQVKEQLGREEYPLPKLWLEYKAPPEHIQALPIDVLVASLDPTKIHLLDYQSHPAIKALMAV